jgi:3-hydroxyacyl-CoA dehydrogenase
VIQTSFRKVAILGAGVMGAQIAAHLANAKVPVILFDLAAKEPEPKNGIAAKAIANLARPHRSPMRRSRSTSMRRTTTSTSRDSANAISSSKQSPNAWIGSTTCTTRSRRT